MKNIAVIAGGDSEEYIISIKSGAYVHSQIDRSRYNPYLVIIQNKNWNVEINNTLYSIDKNDFSVEYDGTRINFDFAYITIHGTPGENGMLQGYFDLLDIPYSTSKLLTEAMTFDKYVCNNYLANFGINVSPSLLLAHAKSYDKDKIISLIGLPCFVKPNTDGSSFGVTKVNVIEEFDGAVENIFEMGGSALVESYIEGQEFTCGLCKIGDKKILMPVAEIIPKNEFFDFEAKYDAAFSEEIIPARFPQELTNAIQDMTSEICDILDCKGIIRVDGFIRGTEIIALEVNTTPGMTSNSFIPKMLAEMKITLGSLITEMIEDACRAN